MEVRGILPAVLGFFLLVLVVSLQPTSAGPGGGLIAFVEDNKLHIVLDRNDLGFNVPIRLEGSDTRALPGGGTWVTTGNLAYNFATDMYETNMPLACYPGGSSANLGVFDNEIVTIFTIPQSHLHPVFETTVNVDDIGCEPTMELNYVEGVQQGLGVIEMDIVDFHRVAGDPTGSIAVVASSSQEDQQFGIQVDFTDTYHYLGDLLVVCDDSFFTGRFPLRANNFETVTVTYETRYHGTLEDTVTIGEIGCGDALFLSIDDSNFDILNPTETFKFVAIEAICPSCVERGSQAIGVRVFSFDLEGFPEASHARLNFEPTTMHYFGKIGLYCETAGDFENTWIRAFDNSRIRVILGNFEREIDVGFIGCPQPPPVANAGDDQFDLLVPGPARYSGEGSSDPLDQTLDYFWEITKQPDGSSPELSGNIFQSGFLTVDKPGLYELTLTVTNVNDLSDIDTVNFVFITNAPPVADAGPDQTGLTIGTRIQLDGSGSSDPDGDELKFSWECDSGIPPDCNNGLGTITDADTATPTFVANEKGLFPIFLEVDDGFATDLDLVTLEFTNTQPVAVAKAVSTQVIIGDQVRLDGSDSFDPDDDSIDFSWRITNQPEDSQATINQDNPEFPTFTPDFPGDYFVELVVNDGFIDSMASSVIILVGIPELPDGEDFDGDGIDNELDVEPVKFSNIWFDEKANTAGEIIDRSGGKVTVKSQKSHLDTEFQTRIINVGGPDITSNSVLVNAMGATIELFRGAVIDVGFGSIMFEVIQGVATINYQLPDLSNVEATLSTGQSLTLDNTSFDIFNHGTIPFEIKINGKLFIIQPNDTLTFSAIQISSLIDDVDSLVSDQLNSRTARALQWLLNAALNLEQSGNSDSAMSKLESFNSRVNLFMNRGIIPDDVGKSLIDSAQAIIDGNPDRPVITG